MMQDKSTSFMDNFFEFLPYDMQQEIIKRCYKRPHPKHCYGDMVVFVTHQPPPATTTQTYFGPIGSYVLTERPNDATDVYCVMRNPVWIIDQWSWQYIIREVRSDNSGYYSTEFLGNIRENENCYLYDCAFVVNEHQLSCYNREIASIV